MMFYGAFNAYAFDHNTMDPLIKLFPSQRYHGYTYTLWGPLMWWSAPGWVYIENFAIFFGWYIKDFEEDSTRPACWENHQTKWLRINHCGTIQWHTEWTFHCQWISPFLVWILDYLVDLSSFSRKYIMLDFIYLYT